MGLLRILLIAFVAWYLWRWFQQRRAASAQAGEPRPLVSMVRCAACGTHVPEAAALALRDRYYCCEEHRSSGGRG